MNLLLQQHLNKQLRLELESSCARSALASLVLIAIYQFAIHEYFSNDSFHLLVIASLSCSLLFRLALTGFKSMSDKKWLLLHNFVVAAHSVLWSIMLLNIVQSEHLAVEVHIVTSLLFAGLVAAAAFSLAISKIDFYVFVMPIMLSQTAVFYLIVDYDHSLKIAGNLLVLLFFVFLRSQRKRVEQNWISVTTLNFELQNIVDAVPSGISVIREDKYAIVNKYVIDMLPAHASIVGQELGSILGKKHDFSSKIIEFKKSPERKTQFETEMSVQGNLRTHLVTASKMLKDEIIISATDIQELKAVEHQMNLQRAKLIQSAKMASLGEMSGGLAHEINNPLAIISMKAQQMIMNINRSSSTPESLLKNLEIIVSTSERIARISKGLQSFSQNQDEVSMAPVKLISIVEDALSFCQEKFRNSNVIFSCEIPADLEINGNANQLLHVILNAFSNSYDAITGQNDKQAAKWIKVQATHSADSVRISITDSGPGIPEEIREKVMQPFFTTKQVGKGTGLGLSISKGIIESHKGQIYFNHETSKNTELLIILPALQNQIAV